MQFNVVTKQGNNFTVSDDSVWVWIELERETGLTMKQAAEKMANGSLDVITLMLFKLAQKGEHTELKTHRAWVEHEFESFDVVDDEAPKEMEA